jgi:hypothetical protein
MGQLCITHTGQLFLFFNQTAQLKPSQLQFSIMKKVSLLLALFIGFVATSFAQVGQGKCAWNAELVPTNPKPQKLAVTDLALLGISNSDGDPAYSVSLMADLSIGKATNVILTETGTGKKWLMNLSSPLTTPAPLACNAGQPMPQGTRVYKSAITNVVVYVSVPLDASLVTVYAYRPAGPQNLASQF